MLGITPKLKGKELILQKTIVNWLTGTPSNAFSSILSIELAHIARANKLSEKLKNPGLKVLISLSSRTIVERDDRG
jgi:PIN domain nuclease of toxin-antitoxin system